MILKNANLTYSDKTKENVGVIARRLENYVKVNRVFAVDSNLASYGNVGFIAGSTGPDNGVDVNTVEISECGTVGGSVSYSGVGSLGGFVGFASSNKFYDNYSIGTIVYGHSAQSAGGYIDMEHVLVKTMYKETTLPVKFNRKLKPVMHIVLLEVFLEVLIQRIQQI